MVGGNIYDVGGMVKIGWWWWLDSLCEVVELNDIGDVG